MWQYVVLAVVASGTAWLVVAALAATGSAVASGAQEDLTSDPVGFDLAPTPAPTPTPTPTPTATPAPESLSAPTRILRAVNDTEAWRSTVGACPGGTVSIDWTTDGGATWQPSGSAAAFGLDTVLGFAQDPVGSVGVVGAAPDSCEPQLLSTTAGSDEWLPADGAGQQWYRLPGPDSSINTPGGLRGTPCGSVVSVAGADQVAAVLCDDHRVFRTGDAGATWDTGATVEGARALAAHAQGFVLAATGRVGCAGIEFVTLGTAPQDGDGTPIGCRATGSAAGEVQISIAGGTLWLWAGDETLVLTQQAGTWS